VLEKEQKLQRALARQDPASSIAELRHRLEDIHAQARRQATRIRMKALQDAIQVAERVSEMAKGREDLGTRVRGLVPGLEGGSGDGAVASARDGDRRFEGDVELEVGPLNDFAQLASFEDAAAAIDGAGEIKVKRVSEGRATVGINLSEPVELLRELEERAPFEFKVTRTADDRVVLDLGDDADERRAA
jgi:hypothetical protein